MIFRVHIPKDIEQINVARKIRALLERADVYSTTYEPEDAQIGIKLHKVPSKKLLGQIFGLIQRGGYEVERVTVAETATATGSILHHKEQKTIQS